MDKRRQWSKFRNVWQSSAIRSTIYTLSAPVRWVRRGPRRESGAGWLSPPTTRSSSAPGRTAWRRPSRWRGRGARCSCSRAPRPWGAARAPRSSRSPAICTTCARRSTRSWPARRSSERCRWPTTGSSCMHPDVPLAHPLDDGTAVVLERSLEATAASIGGADGRAYASADGAARARRREAPARPARAAAAAAPSRAVRALRPERRALGVRPGPRALPRAARSRAVRRLRGPFDAAPGAADHRLVRAGAGACSRTRWAGRSRAAARSRSPTRSPRTCVRSAARSARPVPWSRSTACRRREPFFST